MDWLRPILDGIWAIYNRIPGDSNYIQAIYTWISGSATPRTNVDNGGVVTNRKIDNVKAKNFTARTETVSAPGNPSCGDAGQNSGAVFDARGGGAICVDQITNSTFDGDVDFSTIVKPAQGQ